MVLKVIWKKMRLYKRFGFDIWGYRVFSFGVRTQVGKLFNIWDVQRSERRRQRRTRHVYRIDVEQPFKTRKKQKWGFVRRRLSRLFYLTLSYSQFKQLARAASRREGSWESSFIMLIENRVLGMLYRMQINMNIFELRWFVLLGKVFLDSKKITYYNASVDYFAIINFTWRTAFYVRNAFVERLKIGALYFNIPRYLFISYKHMFAFVFREPKRRDLAFPIKVIDVYRSADYY